MQISVEDLVRFLAKNEDIVAIQNVTVEVNNVRATVRTKIELEVYGDFMAELRLPHSLQARVVEDE